VTETTSCVDGETLAAWTSGALRTADATRVEEHLADCERCQMMLATFARTEPVSPAPIGWRQRWQMRWLVPLATAATVAAIWVMVPQRDVPEPPSSRTFVSSDRVLPAEPSAPTATPQRADQSQGFQQAPATKGLVPNPAGAVVETIPVLKRPPIPNSGVPAAGTVPSPETVRDARAREEAAESRPAAAAPAPPSSPAAVDAIAPKVAQERSAVTNQGTLAARFRASVPLIQSPDDSMRWRIVAAGIELSTDRGASWKPLVLPTPAALTTGHSPASSVAWFVGRAGVIFVTADGSRLEKVPFPQAVDLMAVVAADDRVATVTTITGQRWRTTDRGVIWSPQ
jgi:hypothetical protein